MAPAVVEASSVDVPAGEVDRAPRSLEGRPAVRPSSATLSGLREVATELEQAMLVVAACGEDPASVTLAEGDRLLLAAYRAVAGADLELALRCTACGEVSSVRLGADTVPPTSRRRVSLGPAGELRQPTYTDLLDLEDSDDGTATLLRRCTIGHPSRPATEADLESIDDTLTGAMTFACAGCGVDVTHLVDVQNLALRGLVRQLDDVDHEVHLLASAYGWDLSSIDDLVPERRRRLAALIAADRDRIG